MNVDYADGTDQPDIEKRRNHTNALQRSRKAGRCGETASECKTCHRMQSASSKTKTLSVQITGDGQTAILTCAVRVALDRCFIDGNTAVDTRRNNHMRRGWIKTKSTLGGTSLPIRVGSFLARGGWAIVARQWRVQLDAFIGMIAFWCRVTFLVYF